MNRIIRKAAILGSGIMGSRIACHFANIGIEVLLLDIVPKELTEAEKKQGLTTDSPAFRNRIVNSSLQAAISSSPAPLYKKSFANRIKTGNFTDNMKDISGCDWITEVVVENPAVKKSVFEEVEKYRKPGTLITSNTSGIPISLMAQGRSEDFKKHFCGTHFFNPPRYLKLLEIIPTADTDPAVVDFLMHFGDLHLGKTTVLCKDTPAFIANRIGVFAIMSLLHQVEKAGLTVEEVDKLTGPVLGRPKSATFRTTDVVGLDTMVHVANGLYENCPADLERDTFKLPGFVTKMNESKWFGDKSGQGFYKKTKNKEGKTEILALDLNTMEYRPQVKVKFASLDAVRQIENLGERTKALFMAGDKAGVFYREVFCSLFGYVSNRIPEIADDVYRIDEALKAGFGWEMGPFEAWDSIGVSNAIQEMEKLGKKPASWVVSMLQSGNKSFYKVENGKKSFFRSIFRSIQAGSRPGITDHSRQHQEHFYSVEKLWNHPHRYR